MNKQFDFRCINTLSIQDKTMLKKVIGFSIHAIYFFNQEQVVIHCADFDSCTMNSPKRGEITIVFKQKVEFIYLKSSFCASPLLVCSDLYRFSFTWQEHTIANFYRHQESWKTKYHTIAQYLVNEDAQVQSIDVYGLTKKGTVDGEIWPPFADASFEIDVDTICLLQLNNGKVGQLRGSGKNGVSFWLTNKKEEMLVDMNSSTDHYSEEKNCIYKYSILK